jgi:hypothetical protein
LTSRSGISLWVLQWLEFTEIKAIGELRNSALLHSMNSAN